MAGAGASWNDEDPPDFPPALVNSGMVYDPLRDRVVAFGGSIGPGLQSDDTWAWDGSTRTQLEVNAPPARGGHGMVYDAANDEIVLFGGSDADNDTWVCDGTTWEVRTSETSPLARSMAGLCFDRARGGVVLFGGSVVGKPANNETWMWDGNDWDSNRTRERH